MDKGRERISPEQPEARGYCRYYSNRPTKHAIFVTGVSGDTVTFGDCNGTNNRCQIRWDTIITKEKLRSDFIFIYRAPFELR